MSTDRAALVEKVALAMSNVEWCGAQINGVRVLCDDPRLAEDVMMPGGCLCRRQAHAALTVLEPLLRAEALEEAAKVAEAGKRAVYFDDEVGKIITDLVDARETAAAIRKLIGIDDKQ